MAYVTREEYLQRELTELIPPGFLNHTIYVGIKFPLFAASLLLLVSTIASCFETFEANGRGLLTLTDEIVVFKLIWKIMRIEIVNYEAFYF